MKLQIKQIGKWWVDKNNNMWDCNVFKQEQAEQFSKTLIDCYNCVNCYNCRNCCSCFYCHDCYLCHYCNSCNSCQDCCFCHKCRGYKSNPQRYVTAKNSNKNDQITFYYGETDKGMEIQVVCDYFFDYFKDNIEEFKKTVLETPSNNKWHRDNEWHREQYLKEIAKVMVLFELED